MELNLLILNMFDYIISLNQIFVASIIGSISGFFSSTIIDNYFFENRFKTCDTKYQKIAKTILWSICFSLIICFLCFILATIDYWLGFVPAATSIRFIEKDNFISAFCWAFFAGISNTLMNIFKLFFTSNSSDRSI